MVAQVGQTNLVGFGEGFEVGVGGIVGVYLSTIHFTYAFIDESRAGLLL